VDGPFLQGAKSLDFGSTHLEYGAGQYLLASIDMPVTSRVVRATRKSLGLVGKTGSYPETGISTTFWKSRAINNDKRPCRQRLFSWRQADLRVLIRANRRPTESYASEMPRRPA
jgi:hypothetical protein